MEATSLIGRYEHTIDSNGRLSIPARFREYLVAQSEGVVFMTTVRVGSCIVVYPLPEWKAITRRASQMDSVGEAGKDFSRKNDFLRLFFSRAVECPLDKQGRILIPSHLRGYAGLERDTILVGCVNVFEIWDVNKWQQKEASLLEDTEGLQEAMAGLGIWG